jgi:ribose transport system ATP-binding protein
VTTDLLQLTGVSKTFGGEHALDRADLTIRRGEVHGLLGQNGSGKSTLLKVLSGFHAPDEGRLVIRGEEVALPLAPGSFRDLGLAFVHQDLALVGSLSVTENLMVSRLASSGSGRIRGRIRWRQERTRVAEMLKRYGLVGIDPDQPVSALTPMQRALVAIVRAVEELREGGHEGSLLVLDEPTAFLPRTGIDQLFALVRAVVAEGGSVLFVTHDLDEVREVCDRVTVLRDGRLAGTGVVADLTGEQLVELIIGHKVERHEHVATVDAGAPVVLRAGDIRGGIVAGVDLEVRRGEVLGITGLVGSGFEELAHLLYGSRPGTGSLELEGRSVALDALDPRRAVGLGMGFVPADRPNEAAIGALSVTDNVTMPTLERHRGRIGLSRGRMAASASELGERFAVQPNRPSMELSALSGGNQQKAIMAKWLQIQPRVLLLDQPTQGVDVNAREQIFAAVREAAQAGTAVLVASADYEELAALCDRLLVLARGRVVGELTGSRLTKDAIAENVLMSTSAPVVAVSATEAVR